MFAQGERDVKADAARRAVALWASLDIPLPLGDLASMGFKAAPARNSGAERPSLMSFRMNRNCRVVKPDLTA